LHFDGNGGLVDEETRAEIRELLAVLTHSRVLIAA
jgi:hypothetical protein